MLLTVSPSPPQSASKRGGRGGHMVKVDVALRDGTQLSETVEAPRGSEVNFASQADVVAKFAKLAGSRLPVSQVERVRDLVLGLERLDDAKDLAAALALQP